MSKPAVLHVPFTYFPDPCGGTEVYVHSLATQLASRGYSSSVAAPDAVERSYRYRGVNVHRFSTDRRARMEFAYGHPDHVAAAGFRQIVAKVQPAIVHLHARTAAVSEALVDIAHEFGAQVVFTYHTPTVSCPRGTMLRFGRTVCDGTLNPRRCAACALSARGMPKGVAFMFALLPVAVAQRLAAHDFATPFSALRIPGLIADAQLRFERLITKVDYVVAVCDWVADVLRRNGVQAEKLLISRQGVAESVDKQGDERQTGSSATGPLRIAYFGRLDLTKGVDLLTGALALAPDIDVCLDLYLVTQPGGSSQLEAIRASASRDKRVRTHSPVPSERIVGVMAGYDLIAIPSRWLETGPLVALEAFSAGVPVFGANHGGIAELVRDGIDGILFAPDEARAIAEALTRVAIDRSIVQSLRANLKPPRTMSTVAGEMAALYDRLLSQSQSAPHREAEMPPCNGEWMSANRGIQL